MIDPLTNIELEMKNVLLDIVVANPLPSGYVYYNDVTVVNVDDECVATERGDYPTISIYLNPDEKILSGEQHAYFNEVYFNLVCSVSLNDPVDTPRFEINKKMNEMLADIKGAFSANHTLNCACATTELLRSRRVYNTNGDEFRAGDIIIDLKVKYMQSRLDPNKTCNASAIV